jgi:hypothetical protein
MYAMNVISMANTANTHRKFVFFLFGAADVIPPAGEVTAFEFSTKEELMRLPP